ncbi:MAG: hypothetical protein DRZ79_03950 [Candidatus Cloacimonadota bacterium]|nr:MAG: hypothetical protein DRZ79_03950 [Candidatus Cloacimonadota bacterium]
MWLRFRNWKNWKFKIKNEKREMKNLKKNIIQERTFKFFLNIIDLYKILKKSNEYAIGNQILRSATIFFPELLKQPRRI